MRMLREVLWQLVLPFCTACAFVRYGGFWGIRTVLHAEPEGHPVLERVYKAQMARKGSWIGFRAKIDGRPIFPHDMLSVFISDNAVIGKHCVIFQQVTIGSEVQPDAAFRGSPVVGDNVYIGAGAKIIGGIRVGHNCRIGANATITANLPDNTLAVAARTRTMRVRHFDNERSEG